VGEAIGQVLSLGVGVALSPVPIMLAVFIAIASLGPGLPVAIYFALGARAARARRPRAVDGRPQRGDHGRALPRHRSKLIGEGITGLS
jgi:transketolase N-terminal domain/subunit